MNSIEMDKRKIVYCTYISVWIGCFISSLFFLGFIAFTDWNLLDYGLEDYQISGLLTVSEFNLLFYLVKRRGIQLLIFFILGSMSSYYVAATIYNFAIGAYIGVVFCNMFIKFGFIGIGYGAVCFFPHYILYFITIFLTGKWFGSKSNSKKMYYENVNKMFLLIKIIVILLMFILGIIWEIKFQKIFLNFFYQHIV